MLLAFNVGEVKKKKFKAAHRFDCAHSCLKHQTRLVRIIKILMHSCVENWKSSKQFSLQRVAFFSSRSLFFKCLNQSKKSFLMSPWMTLNNYRSFLSCSNDPNRWKYKLVLIKMHSHIKADAAAQEIAI